MKILKITMVFLISTIGLHAQQSINASGGDATGSNGSVSYSIGQMDYVAATGSNGSISQGVQHPYEIFVLGTDNFPQINLEIKVYPNPTTSNVFLQVGDIDLQNLEYHVFDISGKLISSDKIKNIETVINLSTNKNGIYILMVSDANVKLKSFKIIKN